MKLLYTYFTRSWFLFLLLKQKCFIWHVIPREIRKCKCLHVTNETNYTFIILHAKVKGFHTSFSRRNSKMSVKYFVKVFFKIIFHEQKNKIHRLDINVRHISSIFGLPFTDSPIRSSVFTSYLLAAAHSSAMFSVVLNLPV